ncbi:hypothetical protein MPSEU_000579000 [Mayamaea pseudoterrestris]|nr:hypothetical protein MPSEU_000579000 [Mayamaea pseudoterrestris]
MTSKASIFRSSDAAILVSSPSSTDKKDGTVLVHVEPERTESTDGSSMNASNSSSSKNPLMRLLESSFRGSASKDELVEEEMKNMEGCVPILQSPNAKSFVGDFDICREYSYSGDEQEHYSFQNQQPIVHAKFMNDKLLMHLLGKTYHPIRDFDVKRDDENSLYWFTYRCDFPEIAPYAITSDAGWGCMLRSAMMLLAQAMRMHYKGRNWKPPTQLQRRKQDPFVRSMLTWFADFPSSESNIYSLHNMVAAGLDRQVLPGEWYGPGTACYVMRDLVEMHERMQTQPAQLNKNDCKIFRLHIAADASLYKSSVEDLMTRDSKMFVQKERSRLRAASSPLHPLDNAWECELIELESRVTWDTSLVLLIPLRLGLKTFNQAYEQALAHIFSLPQSIGVLGGRPRGARWFYGAVANGSKIFGLDPHTVQSAPRKRTAVINGALSQVVELSDDYLRSVHTNFPEAFPLAKMDPSVALGFYCKDRSDFHDLLFSFDQWKKENTDVPELFSVCETEPDYSSNVSSVINDMLFQNMNGSLLDDDVSVASDEDEYVVL